MKAISSDANPNFRRWLRLAGGARGVREEGQTLAEGVHLAQAALAAGAAVSAVLLRKGAAHQEIDALLAQLCGLAPAYELAPALFDRIAPVEQGAGLILELPVPAVALPQGACADMVYLDGVQDPGNAGALLRSAAASGVRHVLAGRGTASLWSRSRTRRL